MDVFKQYLINEFIILILIGQLMEEEKEITIQQFDNLKVFLLVKSAQNNNGVKNEDYLRYRRYCSRKINKLRVSMNFKYGNRTKFIYKDIVQEKRNDPKILQVLLFSVEKYWAQSNELKLSSPKDSQNSRVKFHAIKKLRRAVLQSKRLKQFCKDKTQANTKLQTEAYELLMTGLWLFESQRWNESQVKLIGCREIISDLMKSSDSLSERVFGQKMDQIDQRIKYCQFKLSKGKQTMSIQDIINMKKLGDPNLSNLMEILVENRVKEMSIEGNLMNEIKFNQERYPIKSQQIYHQKNKIDTELHNIEEMKNRLFANKDAEQINQELMSAYSATILLIEQAVKMTDKEKEDKNKYTQAEVEILRKISLLFQQYKNKVFINRNQTIFKNSFLGYQLNKNDRKSTPQTLAKLLTNTITLYTTWIDIEKQKSTISNQLEPQRIQSIQARIFYIRSIRLALVGQVYFNNDKIRQAYSLWGECSRCLNVLVQNEKIKKDLVELKQLQQIVTSGKLRCLIRNAETDLNVQQTINKNVKNMNLKETNSSKLSLQKVAVQKMEISLEQYGGLQVIDLPGRLEPIPPRPIFLNIFDSQLVYPSLEKKNQQESKSKWWNKWWK